MGSPSNQISPFRPDTRRQDGQNNADIQDYFLLPTPNLPLSKDRKKLRISDRVFGNFGHDDFRSVMLALEERLRQKHESWGLSGPI